MWTPEKLYCELIFLLFGRTKVQKLMCIKNSFVSVRFCISSETIHFNLGILKCPEDINILRGKKKEKRVSFQCMVTSFYTFLDEFYRNNFFFFFVTLVLQCGNLCVWTLQNAQQGIWTDVWAPNAQTVHSKPFASNIKLKD